MRNFLATMRRRPTAAGLAAAALATAVAVPALSALGTGQSFANLQPGFQQELFGVVQLPPDSDGFATILGGLAFAPDGDVWAAECVFNNTQLHRFDKQASSPTMNGTSSLHPELPTVVATKGGCGLTNHPDGHLYSNSDQGVYQLDPSTGLPATGIPMGPKGNGLGIAVDKLTSELVYVGEDCHPVTGAGSATCTVWALDPATGASHIYASLSKQASNIYFVDGVYFDPTSQYLFLASRSGVEGMNALSIVKRPTGLPFPDDTQLVQSVAMSREPDGVAFYSGATKFVVTLDESGGTMTRFDFPSNDYTATPAQSDFASNGFRGDLIAVGSDGCIYGTQGRALMPHDFATRYDDGTETSEDSIVRICTTETGGGFAEPPGTPEEHSVTGRIGDFVWNDLDRDGVQDSGEPGLVANVTLKDASGTVVGTTTSDANGAYEFKDLAPGSYQVGVTAPQGFVPTGSGMGGDAGFDSNGSPAGVTLTTARPDDATIDFGFQELRGSIGDFVWVDANGNGMQDSGEPGLSATVTLKNSAGVVVTSTSSSGSGAYQFTNLPLGSYRVEVSNVPAGYVATASHVGSSGTDSNGSPAAVTLSAANLDDATIDFGFKGNGRIGDFVWNDCDGDGIQDAGETGLVATIALKTPAGATIATTTSNAAGFYEFTGLALTQYKVEVTAPAGFVAAPANVGANRAVDSSSNPATVSLSSSSSDDTTIDFGFVALKGSIAGFAYKDYNRNGVKDSGEPGISAVSISRTGTSSGSASTSSTGAYSFTSLLAGSYSLAAPSTAAGLTRSTPSPLSVPLAAGQNVTDRNFGYVSNTAPVCTVTTFPNETPYRGTMVYTASAGLKTLVVTKNLNNNFAITIQSFTVGTTSPITLTAKLIDSSKAAQVIAVATDVFGNTVTCDPVVTTVVRDKGREEPEAYTDLPYEESMVTIENDDPGLRGLDIIVNGTLFKVRGLLDVETQRVNIRSAMHPGNDNTVVLIARGRPGGSAVVSIAEPTRNVRRRR